MNKLSYDLVIAAMKLRRATGNVTFRDNQGCGQRVYTCGDFEVCNFSEDDGFSTVVRGLIPPEVIQKIYSKYPDKCDKIVPLASDYDGEPNAHRNRLTSLDNVTLIDACVVDRYEDLLLLLTELQDYQTLQERNPMWPKAPARCEELLTKIYKNMLLEANSLNISSREWADLVGADVIAKEMNSKGNLQDVTMRSLLHKFDGMANIVRFAKRLAVPIDIWVKSGVRLECVKNDGNDEIEIRMGEGDDCVRIKCGIKGHSSQRRGGEPTPALYFKCDYDGKSMCHYYNAETRYSDEAEILRRNTKGAMDWEFDLTMDLSPTSEQKEQIIEHLKEANEAMKQVWQRVRDARNIAQAKVYGADIFDR